MREACSFLKVLSPKMAASLVRFFADERNFEARMLERQARIEQVARGHTVAILTR
jgi:hypothetical protein